MLSLGADCVQACGCRLVRTGFSGNKNVAAPAHRGGAAAIRFLPDRYIEADAGRQTFFKMKCVGTQKISGRAVIMVASQAQAGNQD